LVSGLIEDALTAFAFGWGYRQLHFPTSVTTSEPHHKRDRHIWKFSLVVRVAQSSQQNPCFELYRNPSAGAAGALLLNKCSGQTWVLIGTGPVRWYPISTSREEYVAPPQR
jgi:hypothetical protein